MWHLERGDKCVTSNTTTFLPGTSEVMVLHDGRECLVTTEVCWSYTWHNNAGGRGGV